MIFRNKANSRKSLSALFLAAGIAALTSCTGGGGNSSEGNRTVDVSGVTQKSLRSATTQGLTHGITANTHAFSNVLANSKALQALANTLGGSGAGSANTFKAIRQMGDGPGDSGSGAGSSQIDQALAFVDQIIQQSDIQQNNNVYTFNPDETQVCADAGDTQTVADCESLLSHITFVVTVNNVVNNEVVAATTNFKYDNVTFVTVDFTETSGYYQIELAGLRMLLSGVNQLSSSGQSVALPTTMQGSLRIAFTAPSNNSGSMTVSIPSAIRLADGSDKVSIAETSKLFSFEADGTANTLTVEVSAGALSLISSDTDAAGSFPIRLALSAITGKAVVTDNGNTLTLTNVGIDHLTLKVDGADAASVNLGTFGAVLDASGTHAVATLTDALNFDLSVTNLRGIFQSLFDSTDPNQTLSIQLDAPSGTGLEDVATDFLKVTNGTLDLVVEASGNPGINVSVPDGSCLDTSGDVPVENACPVSN